MRLEANLSPWVPTLHISPRIHFQLFYARLVTHRSEDKVTLSGDDKEFPNILNVGCADDPVGLGGRALHFDMDDWSKSHEHFQQGDAHELPFMDNTFHTVFMGDIIEHLVDPMKAMKEAFRVASSRVVMTVFEEWRLDGIGTNIPLGQQSSDEDSRALGYKDREDAQLHMYPERIGVDDTEHPHLCHIWQFSSELLYNMLTKAIEESEEGWQVLAFLLVPEASYIDGHQIQNWLICAERHNDY